MPIRAVPKHDTFAQFLDQHTRGVVVGKRTLIQIDGEETEYEVYQDGRLRGPCPGCFLKMRLKYRLLEALLRSTLSVSVPAFTHAGCGHFEVIGDTWVPITEVKPDD